MHSQPHLSNRETHLQSSKMKSFIVFALIVAVAVAVPVGEYRDAVILKQAADNIGTGPYAYEYETSDGKKAAESGVLENEGTENEGIAVRGQFSYTGPDGVVYQVTYIADRNGFQPQGAHIPA